MPKRPKTRDIVRRLKDDGYVLKNTEGSHQQWQHPDKSGKITIVISQSEQSIGVLRNIFRQANWTWPPE